MPRTVTQEVYTFDELSDDAKQAAIDGYREGALEYDWWEFVYTGYFGGVDTFAFAITRSGHCQSVGDSEE